MTILTATIASVKFGSVEIEGLMFPDGSYGVAIPQLERLGLVPPNRSTKQLESLLGLSFPSHQKAKTELNSKAVNTIGLLDFERVLRVLDRKGNKSAQQLSDALIGLALTQIFADSFGVKFEEDDRQECLKTRLAGKVTRRTLTDAIKTYLASNEVSANYRQWVFSNCSDKINLALFGKKAAKLCVERGCNRDELRNTHDRASLALIDRIEGHAVRLIDRGMEPQLATQDAIDFYS